MNWIEPTLGGLLIGLGSIIALTASGKVPGISGIVGRLLRKETSDRAWRLVFLSGVVAGAGLTMLTSLGWQAYLLPPGRTLVAFGIAGFLVGFGTRLGGGCTSGHGVCGIGSGARDGLIYTLVFMATGIITVLIWNLLTNGGPGS